MVKLLSLIGLTTLLFGAKIGFAQTIPNQAEFTADRLECYSPELDYKCTYGHRPDADEGITVVARPSLNVSVTYFYHGKELLGIYTNVGGTVRKVDKTDKDDVKKFDKFLETYFPKDLQKNFIPVLKECQKRKVD